MSINHRLNRLEQQVRPEWEKEARAAVERGELTHEEMIAIWPTLDPNLSPAERRALEEEERRLTERFKQWRDTTPDAQRAWQWAVEQLIQRGEMTQEEAAAVWPGVFGEAVT
jgi:polyhydroxyalkanoate synthesis regulator phasin